MPGETGRDRAGRRPVGSWIAAASTREALPFVFLAGAKAQGIPGALVTISAIDGGAPKPLGTHMAVLADGRHVGHVSGGCVEPAIAAEVAPLVGIGQDRIMRFGKGSRFMDIRFPCGGGVDLMVHASPAHGLVDEAISRLGARRPFSIGFEPARSDARISDDITAATGWQDARFIRRYLPGTRLLAAGRGPELEVLANVAAAAEIDLLLATPDEATASALTDLHQPVIRLKTPHAPFTAAIDPWTATVVLFHEHDWEDPVLACATAAPGFYVGALGSMRTHRLRRERLEARGLSAAQIDRVRGPIGLIAHAREPGVLAVSVLAEILAARAELDAYQGGLASAAATTWSPIVRS